MQIDFMIANKFNQRYLKSFDLLLLFHCRQRLNESTDLKMELVKPVGN